MLFRSGAQRCKATCHSVIFLAHAGPRFLVYWRRAASLPRRLLVLVLVFFCLLCVTLWCHCPKHTSTSSRWDPRRDLPDAWHGPQATRQSSVELHKQVVVGAGL